MRTIAMLAAVLALAPPPAAAASRETPDVFAHPQAYVGKEVVVCGYMIGISNLAERPVRGNNPGRGLAVNGQAPELARRTREGESRFCLQGVIRYFGCASQPCFDWMYDYAIEVKRIVS